MMTPLNYPGRAEIDGSSGQKGPQIYLSFTVDNPLDSVPFRHARLAYAGFSGIFRPRLRNGGFWPKPTRLEF